MTERGDNMESAPLKNERDYRHALREIECFLGAEPNALQGARLDSLVALVEAWEHEHFPLD
jgi:HTH-type transcriptional regulator/antitoxin HigA